MHKSADYRLPEGIACISFNHWSSHQNNICQKIIQTVRMPKDIIIDINVASAEKCNRFVASENRKLPYMCIYICVHSIWVIPLAGALVCCKASYTRDHMRGRSSTKIYNAMKKIN